MTTDDAPESRTADFERLVVENRDSRYVLTLYVTGLTVRSLQAIANIRAICAERLQSRHVLTVVDISQDPDVAREQQIIAAPTLIKSDPPPRRRLIGDLSDRTRVLHALGLPEVA
jgi:circadian clock protein KaiB